MQADVILCGGRIHTLDERRPMAQAFAASGGRIVAVGSDDEVLCLRGPATRVVPLRDRLVVPGFVDSHIHFTEWALARREVDVTSARDATEAAERVAERARSTPAGCWISGGRFDPNVWPNAAWPTRRLLDAAAPENPVMLSSKDGHSCWVNSRALAIAGLTGAIELPGGVILRDSSGLPTGILQERAIDLVTRVVPTPRLDEIAEALRAAFPAAHAAGLTGIHEVQYAPRAFGLRALQQLRRDGALRLRALVHLPLQHLDAAIALGVQSGLGDEWLRLGSVKLFADGALGSRTAHLLEPYEGERSVGVATLDPATLNELIGRADAAGWSVAVHAIGDRACREVLDALEEARRASSGRPPLRHRIEHAQLLHAEDLPRLAGLGVVASMQPIHATSDMLIADRHWGARRCALAYAWRSLLDQGTALCFGSDAPVEPFGVLEGIHAAVTRQRPDGSPGPQGWVAEQRLTVDQALRAYTTGAALAGGEEEHKGTLSVGMLADAVVLSRDIFACPPEEILATRVDLTLLDGEIVHERGD